MLIRQVKRINYSNILFISKNALEVFELINHYSLKIFLQKKILVLGDPANFFRRIVFYLFIYTTLSSQRSNNYID